MEKDFQKRVTPGQIGVLGVNEIFVFGSNESGFHGSGAARTAADLFGAQFRVGIGPTGDCYALPTKSWRIGILDLESIGFYIKRFIAYAREEKRLTFLVTEVGCGLAGYTPEDIAPLFKEAVDMPNINLPQKFWDILFNQKPIKNVPDKKI